MRNAMIVFFSFIALAMVAFPAATLEGAKTGLDLWWRVVLPSLLPFFIISELLLNFGIMDRLGRGFERLMRPLFRLPGEAAFGLVMGYCAGFPTGAAAAAGLRRQGLISKEEGERLIAFTNNPSPLFITVGVATGILNTPGLAALILAINYGLNLMIGIFLGIHAPRPKNTRLKPALKAPINPPPLGKLLKNAAQKAGGNIAIIGCYLVFFSVLSSSIRASGIEALLLSPLKALGLPTILNQSLLQGIWEMTLGINSIGSSELPLQIRLPVCSAFLGLGGISVLAQVAAMVADTDIGIGTYLKSRLFHSLSAFSLTYFICRSSSLPASTLYTPAWPALSQSGLLAFALGILFTGLLLGSRGKTPAP